MVEPSWPTETVVARVRTDAATAVRIQDGVAESWAGHVAAVAIAEEVDGHWSVAVHFGAEPDESAVRALIASLGGKALAAELVFETLPPTDWVRKSSRRAPARHGGSLRRAWHARPRTDRPKPDRGADRGDARLRNRPSREHARLSHRPRLHHEAGQAKARGKQHGSTQVPQRKKGSRARHRNRQRRARDCCCESHAIAGARQRHRSSRRCDRARARAREWGCGEGRNSRGRWGRRWTLSPTLPFRAGVRQHSPRSAASARYPH